MTDPKVSASINTTQEENTETTKAKDMQTVATVTTVAAQRTVRQLACINLISMCNQPDNKDHMQTCLFELRKISRKFPPLKNEYKFIYGKLCEIALIKAFQKCNMDVIDLDKSHSIGSEYKNDIEVLEHKFSIKTKLNKSGDIIMINCKSTSDHVLDINTILMVINEGLIYVFPTDFFEQTDYVKRDSGSISFKGKLITHINKNHPEYIYKFPELKQEQKEELDNMSEVDIFKDLYNLYITP